MNKKILILIGAFMLMITVGCDTKERELKCSKTTNDSSGFKIEEVYSYGFSANDIEEFEVTTISTPIKEELEEFLNVFSNAIDASFKELKDKTGITYTSTIKDGSHTLNIKVDYDKIKLNEFDGASDGISDIVNKDKKKISLNETKKQMERADYTCIVK